MPRKKNTLLIDFTQKQINIPTVALDGKLTIDIIEQSKKLAESNLSNKMIAGYLGVSDKTILNWIERGKEVQQLIYSGEVTRESFSALKDYDQLSFTFYAALREARSRLVKTASDKYAALGESTEVDHVKEKILHKTLISLDKEHWSDKDQVVINQQFNNLGERESFASEGELFTKIEKAVSRAIGGVLLSPGDRAGLIEDVSTEVVNNSPDDDNNVAT